MAGDQGSISSELRFPSLLDSLETASLTDLKLVFSLGWASNNSQ